MTRDSFGLSDVHQNFRVHLVHGTWAKGIFGKSKAWTEVGHSVHTRLLALLPRGAALETFLWSGANSVSARQEAARLLRLHLEKAVQSFPNDTHVIVAHSHGGTISNLAVANSSLDGRIKSLICIATPFTYVVSVSQLRMQTGVLAISSVGMAFYWTVLLLLLPDFPEKIGEYFFLAAIVLKSSIVFLAVAVIAQYTREEYPIAEPSGPQTSKMYLLRGSRDEATLVMSTAQAINWGFYTFATFEDNTNLSFRKPISMFAYAATASACLLCGGALALTLFKDVLTLVTVQILLALGSIVYAPAIAGSVLLIGYLALAVATGFWGVRNWLVSAVEVESAPANTACQIYVFSAVNSSGLRHTLYEDEAVLQKVAALVQE